MLNITFSIISCSRLLSITFGPNESGVDFILPKPTIKNFLLEISPSNLCKLSINTSSTFLRLSLSVTSLKLIVIYFPFFLFKTSY